MNWEHNYKVNELFSRGCEKLKNENVRENRDNSVVLKLVKEVQVHSDQLSFFCVQHQHRRQKRERSEIKCSIEEKEI